RPRRSRAVLGPCCQGLLNRRSHGGRSPSGQREPHDVSRTAADHDAPPGRRTDQRQDRERQPQLPDHASYEQLHLGRIHRWSRGTRTCRPSARSNLRKPDVLTPRPLRTLPLFKRDSLPFAKLVEGGLSTGRLMEEVLVAVASRNEPEPFVAHESFDRASHRRRHVVVSFVVYRSIRAAAALATHWCPGRTRARSPSVNRRST